MDNYIVYMHISPSNKRYIGITSMNDENIRWQNGNGYKRNKHFYRAIEKYGWDNFQHIIIARNLTKEEACWLEIELIREWDSTNKNKGYNITKGGDGCNGLKHSEKTKHQLSKKMSGENNGMYGKHHTEEVKEKLRKIQLSLGFNNKNSVAIICITTMRIFPSLREGARFYNTHHSNISECCNKNGRLKSAGKLEDGTPLVWKYLIIIEL